MTTVAPVTHGLIVDNHGWLGEERTIVDAGFRALGVELLHAGDRSRHRYTFRSSGPDQCVIDIDEYDLLCHEPHRPAGRNSIRSATAASTAFREYGSG